MVQMREDAETFFVMARKMLVNAELHAPASSDRFVLASGMGKIATGLEILSIEIRQMHERLEKIEKAVVKAPGRP